MSFFIVEGKSVTSHRGILESHDHITAKCLGGGENAEKRIKELNDLGIIYEARCPKPEAEKRAKEVQKKARDAVSENKNLGLGKNKNKDKDK